jgi:predicted Rossmann fold flavoprotein
MLKFLSKYDVLVVGAGAAGLLASARAAERGMKVLLVEKMEKAGKKLAITGKGRCNITNNTSVSNHLKHVYPQPRFLKFAYATFFVNDIVSLLKKYGVDTNVERGDRVFPTSNSAADVIQALLRYNMENAAQILYNTEVLSLTTHDNNITGVNLQASGKAMHIKADKVIVCTGGKSYPATGSTGLGYKLAKSVGHQIVSLRPALVPIETEGNIAQNLQGISLKNVMAVLWVNGKKRRQEFGEMLFTHFGLSGPIILTLSRSIVEAIEQGCQVEISIDLKPAIDENTLDKRLTRDLNEHGKKRLHNVFKMWLPSGMIDEFIVLLQLDGTKLCHQVSSKERQRILHALKDFRFRIKGYRSFKEAVITAGGVDLNEVDSKTMESKLCKGLYFAGEVLNADADTGGFNLQIAWSTAWVAASSV